MPTLSSCGSGGSASKEQEKEAQRKDSPKRSSDIAPLLWLGAPLNGDPPAAEQGAPLNGGP
eukprot:5428317-Alexandrium_andersonii.AAC.1